jgi:type I restriction enzyme S subunit
MSDWKECKLGDIITLQRGHDLPKSEMISGNIPVAGSNGIIGFHITNFWAHNTTLYVKDFKGNDEIFVYYLLKSIDFKQFNVGSAVPTLNRNHIHPLDVKLPPLPVQKTIASVLSSLDDKIDLLHRQNKTLEAMAETLFRQWFIEEAADDWEVKTLNDILTVKGGSTPSTANPSFWNGNIHWTTPKDVTKLNHLHLFDTERKITEEGLGTISSGLLSAGTLLMTSRAPVGVLAFAEVPLAINQGYIAIIDDKGISKEYIYFWLKSNIDYVHSFSNGSTFEEISKSVFKSLEISIPPQEKICKFQNFVIPTIGKIRTNTRQIFELKKLRDSLLPKLMSGECKLKDG